MDCKLIVEIWRFYRFSGEAMKDLYKRSTHRIALFLFFILFNYFFMPSPSGGSLKTGSMIGANAFDPGTMLLLGIVLIGLAEFGRKKYRK
jgi:hypothetical protein